MDAIGLNENPLAVKNRRDENSYDPSKVLHFVKASPNIVVYDIINREFKYETRYGTLIMSLSSLNMSLSSVRLVKDGEGDTSRYSHLDAYDFVRNQTVPSFLFMFNVTF